MQKYKMKYLTPEWYLILKRCLWDEDYIIEDDRAERKDNEFFNTVYKNKENVFVKNLEFAGYDGEKIDINKARKVFCGRFNDLLSVLETFPQEIINLIPDKRVLALGYASKNNKKKIIEYTEKQKKLYLGIWGEAKTSVNEVEKKMKEQPNLNEYKTGYLSNIIQNESELIIEFVDIPDLIIIDGKIKRQDENFYEWKDNNDLFSPLTIMVEKELDYCDGKFIVNLLMENQDGFEKHKVWEMSIEGSSVKWC
ncbi:MAG: hypothetical protein IKA11_04190 [Clostridia bacterium]|nr:hypothetical protein [Clostridia bacterium]